MPTCHTNAIVTPKHKNISKKPLTLGYVILISQTMSIQESRKLHHQDKSSLIHRSLCKIRETSCLWFHNSSTFPECRKLHKNKDNHEFLSKRFLNSRKNWLTRNAHPRLERWLRSNLQLPREQKMRKDFRENITTENNRPDNRCSFLPHWNFKHFPVYKCAREYFCSIDVF